MNENIISWNFTNWVTIVLMAMIGFFAIGLGQKWYSNRNAPPQTVSSN
jgi:hypothetical protein